jgi:nucleoid-associated protein YgaU
VGAAPTPGAPTQVATAQPSDVVIPEVRPTMVGRGDSLWRISKRVYGKGLRYTVIYDANQPQIQDPNRIYPGQQFVLPSEKQR